MFFFMDDEMKTDYFIHNDDWTHTKSQGPRERAYVGRFFLVRVVGCQDMVGKMTKYLVSNGLSVFLLFSRYF